MIITNATNRRENHRESNTGHSTKGARGVPAVGSSSRMPARTGKLQSTPVSSRDADSANGSQNQQSIAGINSGGFGTGWNLLAPLTAGFVVDALARASARDTSMNRPEIVRQLDQYKNHERSKLRQQQDVAFVEPENLDPELELEVETTDDAQDSTSRTNLEGLRVLRGTGKKVELPQRAFVPAPVRAGRVFQDADNTEEPHKMYKSGWVKLRSHQK